MRAERTERPRYARAAPAPRWALAKITSKGNRTTCPDSGISGNDWRNAGLRGPVTHRRKAGPTRGARADGAEDRRTDMTIGIDEQIKRYRDLAERSLALRGYL